jgi:hypothetical protein
MPRIDAIRQISVTEKTYYHWKKTYGGKVPVDNHGRARRDPFRIDNAPDPDHRDGQKGCAQKRG